MWAVPRDPNVRSYAPPEANTCTLLLPVSATTQRPSPSAASPRGSSSRPSPSLRIENVPECAPSPPNTCTRKLDLSATSMRPEASMLAPLGSLNSPSAVPRVPNWYSGAPPAPNTATRWSPSRTNSPPSCRPPPMSVTTILPCRSIATLVTPLMGAPPNSPRTVSRTASPDGPCITMRFSSACLLPSSPYLIHIACVRPAASIVMGPA